MASRLARRFQLAQLPSTSLAAARAPAEQLFAGLRIAPSLLERAKTMLGAHKPLPIQQAAMRRVFAGESVALHSQTGSGKTLAYMLPILQRLERDPAARKYLPRQALIVCPSRELAMQSCEVARRLQPGSAAVVYGSKPERLRESLLSEPAPLIFATSHQLAALHELLAPDDEDEPDLSQLPHVVRKKWYRRHVRLNPAFWDPDAATPSSFFVALRETLRTVVIDEADAVLEPRGRGGMRNRARRNKALERMPASLAVRKLLARNREAAHPRVQLVLASATLNKRSMRDLRVVADRRAGKIGLITPAMARLVELGSGSSSGTAAIGGSGAVRQLEAGDDGRFEEEADDDWEGQLAALEEAEEKAAATARAARAAALESTSDAAAEGRPLPLSTGGHLSRGGLLHQGVPRSISHETIVCEEARKSDVLKKLLDKATNGTGALLVVRDDLRMSAVLEELEEVGIKGAIELNALGTAAARYHASEIDEGDSSTSHVISAAEDARIAAELPEWARTDEDPPPLEADDEAGTEDVKARARELGGGITPLRFARRPYEPEASDGPSHALSGLERREAMRRDLLREERVESLGGARGLTEAAGDQIIVAHESALRGLDLPNLQLVVLTMMPESVESYIHVAGRTGRAGKDGRVVSIWTQREYDQAGVLTSSLQDLRWKVRYDVGPRKCS